MYITITTSKPTPEQLPEVEAFLHRFLPRVQQQPGAVAVYHYVRLDKGDDSTLIIWESEAAVEAYRTSCAGYLGHQFTKKRLAASMSRFSTPHRVNQIAIMIHGSIEI